MRVAVVGHVEWIEFAVVPHMPLAGEIIHAEETFEEPAGGGPVSAAQLAKLAGEATFYTALGDDELGHRSERRLTEMGLRVRAVYREEPQRRGFVHLDANGERTITVIGSRLGPRGDDPLPWHELAETDAVYFTAGDPAAAREARRAHTLVGTARGLETLREAGIQLHALASSSQDTGGRHEPRDRRPPGQLGGDAAPRPGQGLLRLRRQLRRRSHLRPRRGQGPAACARACRAVRRRMPHRARPLRGSALGSRLD